MEQTRYSATLLMHSQDRNIHSKIFGGHLMRQSLEIAWTNAILFAGALACVRVFKRRKCSNVIRNLLDVCVVERTCASRPCLTASQVRFPS
jgi:hypothetical protein